MNNEAITFNTRKYQAISFDEIVVGDWIQRKTQSGKRFSNTYLVKDVSEFVVGNETWTIVECGNKMFFRHQEINNTFRKVI